MRWVIDIHVIGLLNSPRIGLPFGNASGRKTRLGPLKQRQQCDEVSFEVIRCRTVSSALIGLPRKRSQRAEHKVEAKE